MRARPRAIIRSSFFAMASLTAASTAPALEGTVVDSLGRPIEGARVCYAVGNAELLCSNTDSRGKWSLPESKQDTVRIVADDYLPRSIAASASAGPIELQLAPTLVVKLVDGANGKALADGQVSIVYSTGQSLGPFPVNASGVRIRRVLRPGEVRVVAVAAGYHQERPRSVRLVSGQKIEIEIELRPGDEPASGRD